MVVGEINQIKWKFNLRNKHMFGAEFCKMKTFLLLFLLLLIKPEVVAVLVVFISRATDLSFLMKSD